MERLLKLVLSNFKMGREMLLYLIDPCGSLARIALAAVTQVIWIWFMLFMVLKIDHR